MQKNNFKQDWERIVCLCVFLVILLVTGLGVSLWLQENGGGNASRAVIPPVPRYLDMDRLNLFDKGEKGISVDGNPMAFVRKNTMIPGRTKVKPQVKPAPVVKKKPSVKKTTVAPAPRPAPVVKKAPAMKPVAPAVRPKPQKPAPPPRVITVVYTGIYRGLKQQNAAFLEIQDSKGKRTYSAVMSSGEKIAGLLPITEVSEARLKLRKQDGSEAVVRRDEVWKVNIHE